MTELLPIVVAAVAALAILLIFLGLAGSSPVDPVQARLTQLGTMQAKNLEELELQQPFIERTLRPLATRMSGMVARVTSQSFTERTEKRLALALLSAEISHEIAYPLNFFRHLLRQGGPGRSLDTEDIEIGREEIERLERMLASLRRLSLPPPRLRQFVLLGTTPS